MRGCGRRERKKIQKKNINLMWNDLWEICVYIEQATKKKEWKCVQQ